MVMVKRVVEEEVEVGSELGSRLRYLRGQAGLTQQELAEKAGVNIWTMRRWEYGHGLPSLTLAMQIAQALGTSMDVLCGLAPLP